MKTAVISIERISLHPDLFYRHQLKGIHVLAKSMEKSNGLLQPIGVDSQYRLIWGLRRVEAAKFLGWESIPARVVDVDDPLQAIEDENNQREDFTPSEKVALAKLIEAREKVKAKERQQAGRDSSGQTGGRGRKKLSESFAQGTLDKPSGNLPEGLEEVGRAKGKAAESVGMSRHTLEKAQEVVEAAEADPALQPIVDEMDRTGNVSAAHRAIQEQDKHEPLTDDKGTIVPEQLEYIFSAKAEFNKASYALDRAVGIWKALEETAAYQKVGADRKAYATNLATIARRARVLRPCLICPSCKGAEQGCKDCDHKGYLTVEEAKQ